MAIVSLFVLLAPACVLALRPQSAVLKADSEGSLVETESESETGATGRVQIQIDGPEWMRGGEAGDINSFNLVVMNDKFQTLNELVFKEKCEEEMGCANWKVVDEKLARKSYSLDVNLDLPAIIRIRDPLANYPGHAKNIYNPHSCGRDWKIETAGKYLVHRVSQIDDSYGYHTKGHGYFYGATITGPDGEVGGRFGMQIHDPECANAHEGSGGQPAPTPPPVEEDPWQPYWYKEGDPSQSTYTQAHGEEQGWVKAWHNTKTDQYCLNEYIEVSPYGLWCSQFWG